ncbi:sodium/potassium/calcium exchanger 1-like, partial [Limulus polyphemus]|uniref:Sodium/potassium/calcium exchanger 1-like n=1 Tax=Limulus polyphemus TaxID=6850 RepID=A0ABM1RUN6_LIMPO
MEEVQKECNGKLEEVQKEISEFEKNFAKRRMSTPILHAGTKFRHGLLQLMIHSIDPLHEGKLDEKASQLHAIASLRVLLDATRTNNSELQNGAIIAHATSPTGKQCLTSSSCSTCKTSANCICNGVQSVSFANASADIHNHATTPETQISPSGGNNENETFQTDAVQTSKIENNVTSLTLTSGNSVNDIKQMNPDIEEKKDSVPSDNNKQQNKINKSNSSASAYEITADVEQPPSASPPAAPTELQQTSNPEKEEETASPLDISWPDTWRKRLNYVLLAPIIFPLWLTLPDVRKE